MAAPRSGLKGQDILLLLKLLVIHRGKAKVPRQIDLSQELGISQAEITHALKRLKRSGLLGERGDPNRLAAREFFVHALKYVFPADRGSLERGVPTGIVVWQYYQAGAKADQFEAVASNYENRNVWPHAEGSIRGLAIEPIYPSVPKVAKNDSELHFLLALVDSIRGGTVRERLLAEKRLDLELSSEPLQTHPVNNV